MKGKPQPHFWIEKIGYLDNGPPGPGYIGTTVYALNVCRAWDLPANGVFLIFRHDELYSVRTNPHSGYKWTEKNQHCYDLALKKLEAREKALVDWYGRQAKHHLADTELLPSERRARTAASHRADFEAR